MTRDEILWAREEYLFPSTLHYFREPLVVARAKGPYLYDFEGREYLDFFGGIVVISAGHCNEYVNVRVKEQMDTLQHCSTLLASEPPVALAKKLAEIAPGQLRKTFFTNSGTEANEMAILAARLHTGWSDVVALRYSYHGRSSMTLAMTGQSVWRIGTPVAAGVSHAHNAYCYRCPYGLKYPSCDVRCAEDVRETIRTTTSGRIAAFIAEPIQGTGGFITPPRQYFPRVAEIVREYCGLFISDEVQSACGRTGKWFAIEHWGVDPDLIAMAKGLANGTPIGATIATPPVAASMKQMTISTFGGNPVATTAALAVIEFIEENLLLENAEKAGNHLRERLEELQQRHPLIGDVRGMGLMQALELVRDRGTKEPASAETLDVMEAGRKHQILFGKGGLSGNVLRITPPLNTKGDEIDEFCRKLDLAFTEVESS